MEFLLGWFDRITSEVLRIISAWLLVVTTLLWVLAAFKVVGASEPPFVLHLSIAAIWFSVATLLIATDLENKSDS
jgi:hypothetical protein